MTNFPHFDVEKSIIKKFFLAHQEKFGKYDLKNGFGKYYFSSIKLSEENGLLSRGSIRPTRHSRICLQGEGHPNVCHVKIVRFSIKYISGNC